jgi:hypothetical protein
MIHYTYRSNAPKSSNRIIHFLLCVLLFSTYTEAVKQCNTYPVGFTGDDNIEFTLIAISPMGTGIAVAGMCEDGGCGHHNPPNPVIEYYQTSN